MTSSDRDQPVTTRSALARTPDCVPIERLDAPLTPSEAGHLASCGRCQSELALLSEFEDSTARAGEGAAVSWIVASLRRRGAPLSPSAAERPWWRWQAQWQWARLAAAAATIALVAVAGYGLWDSEPAVRTGQNEPRVYRAGGLQAVAPIGDVAAVPRQLQWAPFGGATVFEVRILEVDRAVLWQGTTTATQIEIPTGVIAQLVPGKTVLWEVSARDAAGAVVAESGTQRLRVTASPGNVRDR